MPHTAHCLRCKAAQSVSDGEILQQGARRVLVGHCDACGGKVSRYVAKDYTGA